LSLSYSILSKDFTGMAKLKIVAIAALVVEFLRRQFHGFFGIEEGGDKHVGRQVVDVEGPVVYGDEILGCKQELWWRPLLVQ